ncbi:YvrJ family protein [Peribacillus saganii]|uniref:YvrJ family protein n=1 Tax=Peribacillus saganii TaxID=2303992 RepID=A0A372LS08_9BACI|nr:YvrJ family protein [Peribacillus saganii]RFU70979.1 YvrJ family protein [Peribacillus saganii]
MDQLLPFVSEVGFPIIVTLYLLHRIEAKLDALNESILSLPNRLAEEPGNRMNVS